MEEIPEYGSKKKSERVVAGPESQLQKLDRELTWEIGCNEAAKIRLKALIKDVEAWQIAEPRFLDGVRCISILNQLNGILKELNAKRG